MGRQLALGIAALVVAAGGHVGSARAAAPSLPPIRHVWVIVEENASWGYDTLEGTTGTGSADEHSFGAASVPYLTSLARRGNLLTRYYGIGHNSQANYVAMSSGQSPTPGSQSDGIACAGNKEIQADAPVDPHGQIVGQGCFYPPKVKTLADQLEAKGLRWKGYMQDLDGATAGDGGRCPRAPLDLTHPDAYAPKHDPWIWFHSIVDDQPRCQGNDVPLRELATDLQSVATTPNFSFVIPGLFSDGHDGDRAANEDTWLRQYVPMIMSSPAYRQDGMLLIVFDEAGTFLGASEPGEHTDACCNEIPGPNSSMPGESGPGGGRTGALVLSPFARPGTLDDPTDNATHAGPGFYNQYSLLRSMEDLFGIDSGGDDGHGHLGFAGTYLDYPGPGSFGADVYNGYAGNPGGATAPEPAHGPTGARAADGSVAWQSPLPQGNDLNAVACPTADACFAAGDGGAIVASSDGGESWSHRRSGTAAALRGISCPSAAACVAVGDGGAIVASPDAGNTWLSHDLGNQALRAVACPGVAVCVAVGDGGTILRSEDGGIAWAPHPSGTTEALHAVSCPSPSVCYAAGQAGVVLKSQDGGVTWSPKIQANVSSQRLRALSCADALACLAVGDGGSVQRTTDGGTTWEAQGSKLSGNPSLWGASCPAAQACFLAGEIEGPGGNAQLYKPDVAAMYATTDGGGAWSRQATHSTNLLRGVSCPTATRCVAVGMRGSILRTGDGGAAWATRTPAADGGLSRILCLAPAQQECLTEGLNTLRGVSFPDAATGFAVGNFRTVMRTTDGGGHWTTQTSGAPGFDPTAAHPPVPPPELNAIDCSNTSTCVAVGDARTAVTTSDGGATWTDRETGPASDPDVDLLGVACPGDQTCFAAGSRGAILKSTDSGETWRKLDSGTDRMLSSIDCGDATTCVAVGNFGTLLRTTDGGDHWSTGDARTSSYLAAVSCPAAELCVAVGSGGTVLRITGAGTEASVRPSGVGDDLMAVSCSSRTHCLATGGLGTVISTATGGNDWDVQGAGTPRALRAASCPAADRCAAVGDAAAILGVTPTAKPGAGLGGGGSGGGGGGGGGAPGGGGPLGVIPPVGAPRCVPQPLRSQVLRRGLRLTIRQLYLSGTAIAHRCRPDRITRVEVVVGQLERGRCRFLTRHGRLSPRRACTRPIFLPARLRYVASRDQTRWTLVDRVLLPRGRYRILTRSRDRYGTVETGITRRVLVVTRR
ncbi:MAG: phosphatidylinositol-3-phosphatase [Solirubrobacteraceae bacterium]|jgi:photosystem II stability/assembly factor-like uncharacterized protein|nr:phosphatidylinositol-3-phosphatase [Solirubrobacteraceae bacterium]